LDAGAGGRVEDSPSRGGTGHRRRRAARRTAIDVLYQADIRGCSPSEALSEWRTAGRAVPDYAEEIVTGVEAKLADIDRDLGASAEDWTVPRMAAVDRAILRVACFEMRSGLPPAVAIDEAVTAANELSTAASGRFINGVLGRVGRGPPPETVSAGDDEGL
jgi:transcription antitermination protein NusB